MIWTLFIFWWGSHAAVVQKIENLSESACQNMAQQINSNKKTFYKESVSYEGHMVTMCVTR